MKGCDFMLNRRNFIKNAALGVLAVNFFPETIFAADTKADLVVFGKIFTAENNQLAEAFAVKDGKFIFVGGKNGVAEFIDKKKTEIIDYTGKGLIMPSCGNGHAHYSIAHAIQSA